MTVKIIDWMDLFERDEEKLDLDLIRWAAREASRYVGELEAENERLRAMVSGAYCEGFTDCAENKEQEDRAWSSWERSDTHKALKSEEVE